ncbi:MAG: nucleotide exchange factor GrpE [Burkholderiaceae bacterium]
MTKYPFEFNDQKPGSESSPPASGQDQSGPAGTNPLEIDPALSAGTIDSHIEPPPVKESKDDRTELETRLKEREDQLIRLAAEVENMRKRHAQELANASKFAIEGFAESLLPVGDSLEMALQLPNQTLEGLTNGVHITLKQLQQAFEKGRLSVVNPVGEKFDPNRHQAVSMVDGKTQEPPVASGHVVTVMQKGYLIGDRVLRPALVAVAQ